MTTKLHDLAKTRGASHIVSVPATSANIGVGFDTLGIALDVWNHFVVKRCGEGEQPSLETLPESPYHLGPKKGWEAVSGNIFFQALDAFYAELKRPCPAYEVAVQVAIPVARGLGSSATAVVGAMMAANAIEGHPLSDDALLRLAIRFEGHPDNVAPAMLGGCNFGDDTQSHRLPWPEAWKTAVWIPEDTLLTEAARQVLPEAYPRSAVVTALRNSAQLLHAIHTQDTAMLRDTLEADVIHEPYRKTLIEGFDRFRATLHAQADIYGVTISGSGSTCLVIYPEASEASVKATLNHWQAQWGGQAHCLYVEMNGVSIQDIL